MSEKLLSRRGALSLLGLAAAVGFAVPTTVLTTSDAEAQAPAAPAPTAPAPVAPAPSGMTRGEQRRAARRAGRQMRREARHNARQMRRQARRGMFMKSNQPMKQQ
jgi:hypothetical protein